MRSCTTSRRPRTPGAGSTPGTPATCIVPTAGPRCSCSWPTSRSGCCPWAYLRLLIGSLLRALGLAVAKAPGESFDEVMAMLAVLGRPDRVIAARSRRRGLNARSWSEIRPLLAPTGIHFRQGLEAVAGVLSVGTAVRSVGGSALESGPTADGDDDLGPAGPGPLRRALSRPGTWLAVLLLTLAAVRRSAPVRSGVPCRAAPCSPRRTPPATSGRATPSPGTRSVSARRQRHRPRSRSSACRPGWSSGTSASS